MSQPKKSSVAQTFNQLSLFLKEKGCFRDLHLGINSNFDDTVKSPAAKKTIDLLSNIESKDQNNVQSEKLTDLKPEPKTSQMTIFYDGKVIVLDDVPAERARDVMLAAGKYPSSTVKTENHVELATNSTRSSDLRESNQQIRPRVQPNGLDLPIARRATPSSIGKTENHVELTSNAIRSSDLRESNQQNRVRVQPTGLDLPIARRASLHKFLAKRKDRAAERAPYQLHNPSPAAGSSKNEHKFDLNL